VRSAATAAIIAAAVLSTSLAWSWLAGAAAVHPHAARWSMATFATSVVMWQAMMVAMMTPAVAPWVSAYARLVGGGGLGPLAPSFAFAAGYFAIWLVYSLAAAVAQLVLAGLAVLAMGGAPPLMAGTVLVAAGAFQFTPLKRSCLSHCRNPLSYLVARWIDGPAGGFRLGITHGAYCVGCCWMLMITGFAVGLMNLAWMAVLTVVVTVEQLAPGGAWLGRLFGAGLIAWGLGLCWAA
jgi:predicted metal-binding membrane protein